MKPNKILALLSVATLLVVSLLLAACGDNTPASTGNAVANTGSNTTSAASNTTAASTQDTNSATTPAANNGAANGNSGPAGSFGGNGTPGGRRNGTPGARFNGTPGAGRNGTPGARFNGTPGANFAQQMTPENVVNRLYTDFKNSQLGQIDNILVSQKLRDSLGQQADQQLGVMMGLTSGQKVDSFTVDTPSVSGDNATVKVTLKLTDGSTITDNLTLVKSTFSFNGRPPAQNGQNGQPADPNGNNPPADPNGQTGSGSNAGGTPGPNGNGAQVRGPRQVWQIDQITASK